MSQIWFSEVQFWREVLGTIQSNHSPSYERGSAGPGHLPEVAQPGMGMAMFRGRLSCLLRVQGSITVDAPAVSRSCILVPCHVLTPVSSHYQQEQSRNASPVLGMVAPGGGANRGQIPAPFLLPLPTACPSSVRRPLSCPFCVPSFVTRPMSPSCITGPSSRV